MRGVAALWRVFRVPAMQGLFEIYLAARTEPELGRAIEPLLLAHRENIHREARALLPELAAHPGLAHGVDAVVWAMQGVALGVFSSDERREREYLDFFERLAIHELAAATQLAAVSVTEAPVTTPRAKPRGARGKKREGA